ncbi:protein of unknown function [Streptantibioticus cattleyicolor NRRL 8057 = DSM 46488]|nr:protein of unknown function [Streptantibioticus cattleyicolor NRRL 8057 = DSM 46488]
MTWPRPTGCASWRWPSARPVPSPATAPVPPFSSPTAGSRWPSVTRSGPGAGCGRRAPWAPGRRSGWPPPTPPRCWRCSPCWTAGPPKRPNSSAPSRCCGPPPSHCRPTWRRSSPRCAPHSARSVSRRPSDAAAPAIWPAPSAASGSCSPTTAPDRRTEGAARLRTSELVLRLLLVRLGLLGADLRVQRVPRAVHGGQRRTGGAGRVVRVGADDLGRGGRLDQPLGVGLPPPPAPGRHPGAGHEPGAQHALDGPSRPRPAPSAAQQLVQLGGGDLTAQRGQRRRAAGQRLLTYRFGGRAGGLHRLADPGGGVVGGLARGLPGALGRRVHRGGQLGRHRVPGLGDPGHDMAAVLRQGRGAGLIGGGGHLGGDPPTGLIGVVCRRVLGRTGVRRHQLRRVPHILLRRSGCVAHVFCAGHGEPPPRWRTTCRLSTRIEIMLPARPPDGVREATGVQCLLSPGAGTREITVRNRRGAGNAVMAAGSVRRANGPGSVAGVATCPATARGRICRRQ